MLKKIRSVRQSELLRGLGSELAARVEALSEVRTFSSNELVHQEGERGFAVFCVLKGLVRLTKMEAASGREADVAICEPGETFGEYLLVDGARYATAARAVEGTSVALLDLAGIQELAKLYPDLQVSVARIMSRHLTEAFQCIGSDRLQTAPQRVANYFLRHCPDGAVQITFRLPYQKRILAGKLGLAPEALSRAFAALSHAGVAVRGSTVSVSSVDSLKAIR